VVGGSDGSDRRSGLDQGEAVKLDDHAFWALMAGLVLMIILQVVDIVFIPIVCR
jgi:predicted transcriptional regulator